MGLTPIQWTDRTWSPLRARVKIDAATIAQAKGYTSLINIATKMVGHVGPHCERVSHGCDNCYSDTNNGRCLPANGTGLPFDRRARDLVDAFVDEKILRQPLSWKKPQRIFVENQSDLFGEWNTNEMIDRVFAVMALSPEHSFQVLTKRPERMAKYLGSLSDGLYANDSTVANIMCAMYRDHNVNAAGLRWPLPNVWLGISCEDQATADERIPILLQTPAAIRFVSYEPAIGPVTIYGPHGPTWNQDNGIDWVIVGGESGNGARPFDLAWARETIKKCAETSTACFVKQLGRVPITQEPFGKTQDDSFVVCAARGIKGSDGLNRYTLKLNDRKGGDMSEWPSDLCVRQFPDARGFRA